MRLLGAALVLTGSLLLHRSLLLPVRRAQRARRELAEAFEALAQEIRLSLTPLPQLLSQSGRGAEADSFFSRVLAHPGDLAARWSAAAEELPLEKEERAFLALLGARIGNDADGAALTLGARRLRERYERMERVGREREKLTGALCLSLGALLCTVLL